MSKETSRRRTRGYSTRILTERITSFFVHSTLTLMSEIFLFIFKFIGFITYLQNNIVMKRINIVMRRNSRKNILNLKRKNTISHNLGEKARQIENRRGLRWSSCPPFHFWAGCFSMSALLFSWGPGQNLCGD